MFRAIFFLTLILSCTHRRVHEGTKEIASGPLETVDTFVKTIDYNPGPTARIETPFIDKTHEYGLLGVTGTHFYAVDFDNDGDTDLVVLPEFYSIPRFFKFYKKEKRFIEISYSPFVENIRVSYLSFVDFNRDGQLDLVAGTLNQRSELKKEALRFFKAKIIEGKVSYTEANDYIRNLKPMATASLSFLDFDLDGNLDLYLGNWFNFDSKEVRPSSDKLYYFKEGSLMDNSAILSKEKYKDKKAQTTLNDLPTYGVSICDIDQNGYPDILTASSSGHPNRLWMNTFKEDFGRIFVDYGVESEYAHDQDGALSFIGGGNTLYSICADYNNDGFMDIVVGELSHAYDPQTRDRSAILTGANSSIPPRFIRTEYYREDQVKDWDQGDRRGVWFDYDLDGLQDLLIENSGFPPSSRLILFKQNRDHSFEEVSLTAGIDIVNPSGPITLDVNGDGQLDIIVGQTNVRDSRINQRIYLFENNIAREGKRSLEVHLFPENSNLDAIGAMVILKTSRGIQRRFVSGSYGPLPSQSEKGLIFGLDVETPISIEVRWPYLNSKERESGATTRLKKYDISTLQFSKHFSISLCENGRWSSTKGRCQVSTF